MFENVLSFATQSPVSFPFVIRFSSASITSSESWRPFRKPAELDVSYVRMSGSRTCASPVGSAAPSVVSVLTKLAPKSRQSFTGAPALNRFLSSPWLNTVLIAGLPIRSIWVLPASVDAQTPICGLAGPAVSMLLGSWSTIDETFLPAKKSVC